MLVLNINIKILNPDGCDYVPLFLIGVVLSISVTGSCSQYFQMYVFAIIIFCVLKISN